MKNAIPPFPYLPALSVGEIGRCSLTSVQPLKCWNERPIRPFQQHVLAKHVLSISVCNYDNQKSLQNAIPPFPLGAVHI